MKNIKTMAVGAVAAALLLGSAGWADDLKTMTTRSQQTTQVQRTPSEDWTRGVPGQDSDIHATTGSAIQDDNLGVGGSGLSQDNGVSNSTTLDPSLGRVGSGGTGDLDRNQQGDLRMGSDTQLGIGGSGDTTTTTTKTTKEKTTKGKATKGTNTSDHAMGTPKNATGTSTNGTGANEGVDKNPTQPNPNRAKDTTTTPAPAPTP